MWWFVLLVSLVLVLYAVYIVRKRPDKYHVVVAKYMEDISWVTEKYDPKLVKVYDKFKGDLPNVGREAHTYLTYIIDYYDKLPEIVFFTQGTISDLNYQDINFLEINKHSKNLVTYKSNYYFYCPKLGWNNDHVYEWRNDVLTKDELGFTRWFKEYVDSDVDISSHIVFWQGAIFSVRRECILSRPKEYYQRLLDYIPKTNAPEVAHYMERAWFYIFNCYK